MSMPASAKAEPPDAPVDVAYLPDASMEVRMFSTLIADNAEQPSQARPKTPVVIVDGFQLEKIAGKSVNKLLFTHAPNILVALDGSIWGKLVRLVSPQA